MLLPKEYWTNSIHLNDVFVVTGQKVKKGEIIGSVGMTGGTSTAPHLHFEVWKKFYSVTQYENDSLARTREVYADPLEYLKLAGVSAPMDYDSDAFGNYFLKLTPAYGYHPGTDFNKKPSDLGHPVVATHDGEVVFAGEHRGFGKHVIIKHQNTMENPSPEQFVTRAEFEELKNDIAAALRDVKLRAKTGAFYFDLGTPEKKEEFVQADREREAGTTALMVAWRMQGKKAMTEEEFEAEKKHLVPILDARTPDHQVDGLSKKIKKLISKK